MFECDQASLLNPDCALRSYSNSLHSHNRSIMVSMVNVLILCVAVIVSLDHADSVILSYG